MKVIFACLLIGFSIFNACKDAGRSWKENQNTDYNKDSVLYDSEHFYMIKQGSCIVVTFESGEYDPGSIKNKLLGVIKTSGNKVWIDTSYCDISLLKEYFSEFTNRRMR